MCFSFPRQSPALNCSLWAQKRPLQIELQFEWNGRHMKPGFALSLSFEGISLLHRAAGGWRTVGDVTLESPDLGAALIDLREKADRLAPDGMACKLIIPNDQIRYLTIETGSAEDAGRTEMVLAALDGATPYPVSDLAFDTAVEGDMTHIAAVARETLAEAEAFAVEHMFNPVSFVAIPGDNLYLGEPNFGATAHAAGFLGDDRAEADHVAVVIVGMANIPEHAPKPEAVPGLEPESAPEPDVPVAGFSSRRNRSSEPALLLDTPVKPRPKAPTDPIAGIEPAPAAPSLAGATRDDAMPQRVSIDAPSIQVEAEAADSAAAVPVPPPPPAQFPDPPPPPKVEIATKKTGFLSRRNNNQTDGVTAPAHRVAPLEQPPTASTHSDSVADEAQRMTVFGARTDPDVGGKPRYFGLILTAALLLFLAGIAVWASLFMDTKLSRGLFLDPGDSELAAEPEPVPRPLIATEPQDAATTTVAALDTPVAPLPAPIVLGKQPGLASVPSAESSVEPDLTDTDAAVLDALRNQQTPNSAPSFVAGLAPIERMTGTGQTAPQRLETPAIIGLDDIFIASIDRTDLSHDAVALPSLASLQTDNVPGSISSPAAAGTEFALDARGQVIATVEGAVSPDGVVVYLGQPPIRPPPTPARDDPEAEQQEVRSYLASLRPLSRPDDLMELAERASLGGLTRAELGRVRPLMRPERPVIAEVAPENIPEDAASTGTKLAVAVSVKPLLRPAGLARTAKPSNLGSVAAITKVATIAPRTVKPSIPSSASVARQATLDNAINLRKINLIGVYGTPANRRALVRLPSGRYKKIKVGDNIDGGRVLAISDSELRYQKGGRNMTLKIPSG